MEGLDLFLKGCFRDFSYEKYNHTYGLVSYTYLSRFHLIYEGDISPTTDLISDYTFRFVGMFDTKEEVLYVVSDYYNVLYTNSNYKKVLISDLKNTIQTDINKAYNKYIEDYAEYLKGWAKNIAEQFYSYDNNIISLYEKAKDFYIGNVALGDDIKFTIDIVTTNLDDICNYIIDKKQYITNIINFKLNYEKEYRVCSNYCGIPDIKCSLKEYIGFRLIEKDKIQDICNDIDNDKYDNSAQLKKLKSIVSVAKEHWEMKNIIIGFKYNNKSIEVSYPLSYLCNLRIDDYAMSVKDRDKFNDLFEGLDWTQREEKILAIKYLKYRNKNIYEDESL